MTPSANRTNSAQVYDTFEVPAQGKFYVAGVEVPELAYRRVESLQGIVDMYRRALPKSSKRWEAELDV